MANDLPTIKRKMEEDFNLISQIKENQFTPGGQLQIASSQEEYIGYFWVTSKNEYFTGRNPQDTPSVPLQLIPVIPKPKVSLLTYSEGNKEYKNLKNANVTKALRLPHYQKPYPTNEDYQKGRIQRYFAKKINENLYALYTDKMSIFPQKPITDMKISPHVSSWNGPN